MIAEKVKLTERIGNFMSSIILGETKQTIALTNEKVSLMQVEMIDIRRDLKNVRERLPVVEEKVSFLQTGMLKLGEKVETLQSGFDFLNGRVETMILSMKNK